MVSSSILLSIEEVTELEFLLRGSICTLGIELHTRFFDLLSKLVFEEGLREDPSSLEGMETRGVQ